jgi:hypothetical protein
MTAPRVEPKSIASVSDTNSIPRLRNSSKELTKSKCRNYKAGSTARKALYVYARGIPVAMTGRMPGFSVRKGCRAYASVWIVRGRARATAHRTGMLQRLPQIQLWLKEDRLILTKIHEMLGREELASEKHRETIEGREAFNRFKDAMKSILSVPNLPCR